MKFSIELGNKQVNAQDSNTQTAQDTQSATKIEAVPTARVGILAAFAALTIVCVLALAGCGGQSSSGSSFHEESSKTTYTQDSFPTEDVLTTPLENGYQTGIHHARMEVKDYGTIELELDANTAPITVSNFARLANEGFYNGLTFHRIVPDFVIQGGDPNGDGTGGSNQDIKGEFASNGVQNNISHTRGVISMARSSAPDSASSQFFICLKDENTTSLDGQYAAFGKVTQGMDVVDKIAALGDPSSSSGTLEKDKQPVITTVTMVD